MRHSACRENWQRGCSEKDSAELSGKDYICICGVTPEVKSVATVLYCTIILFLLSVTKRGGQTTTMQFIESYYREAGDSLGFG